MDEKLTASFPSCFTGRDVVLAEGGARCFVALRVTSSVSLAGSPSVGEVAPAAQGGALHRIRQRSCGMA